MPVVAASLCCLSPVVLVLLGLSSASAAASLADTLYGTYKWVFRGVGLAFLCCSIVLYLRGRGICTLTAARRHRNEVINTIVLALCAGVAGYFFFLYVVVEAAGWYLGIW